MSGFDDLIKFLASAQSEQQWSMHVLEIISLMFRDQVRPQESQWWHTYRFPTVLRLSSSSFHSDAGRFGERRSCSLSWGEAQRHSGAGGTEAEGACNKTLPHIAKRNQVRSDPENLIEAMHIIWREAYLAYLKNCIFKKICICSICGFFCIDVILSDTLASEGPMLLKVSSRLGTEMWFITEMFIMWVLNSCISPLLTCNVAALRQAHIYIYIYLLNTLFFF